MKTSSSRWTRAGACLETRDLTEAIQARLISIAGKGTALHQQHRLYIDVVSNGTPFLPQIALYHPQTALNATLSHLELHVLDVVDVVVAKLKRFHGNDRSDIEAMVDLGKVPHERLVARFKEAVDYLLGDARSADLPDYWGNLNVVERDFLDVAETAVDLPEWVYQ